MSPLPVDNPVLSAWFLVELLLRPGLRPRFEDPELTFTAPSWNIEKQTRKINEKFVQILIK